MPAWTGQPAATMLASSRAVLFVSSNSLMTISAALSVMATAAAEPAAQPVKRAARRCPDAPDVVAKPAKTGQVLDHQRQKQFRRQGYLPCSPTMQRLNFYLLQDVLLSLARVLKLQGSVVTHCTPNSNLHARTCIRRGWHTSWPSDCRHTILSKGPCACWPSCA